LLYIFEKLTQCSENCLDHLEIVIICRNYFSDMVKARVVTSFILFWSILTIVALIWGVMFDWPDYVHVNYGFPIVWAKHTLITLHGPVDIWEVDVSALLINLIFWLGSLLVGVTVMLHSSTLKRGARQKR